MTRLHRLGWLCFLASSIVFLVIGIRDRDALAIAAGVLFAVGCAAFLIPGE